MDRLRLPPSPCNGDHGIFHAVWAGAVEETASWLRSVHVQIRHVVGISLIHYAVTNHQFAMVQFLIEQGANVNELHEIFATPLHIAAKFGSDTMVRLLLDSGGDPNIASESGITPLTVALFFFFQPFSLFSFSSHHMHRSFGSSGNSLI